MLNLSMSGFVPIRSSLLVINARRVTPQRGEHDSTSCTGIVWKHISLTITNDVCAFDLDEGQQDLVRAIVSPGVAASFRPSGLASGASACLFSSCDIAVVRDKFSLLPHPPDPMSSQWYVKVYSHTRSPKQLRISQIGLIKSFSNTVTQSPKRTPPSPRHHPLAILDHRFR